MDKPNAETVIKSLSTQIGVLNSKIDKIEKLGSDGIIEWVRNEKGLIINAQKVLPFVYAHGFKIYLERYSETDIGSAVEDHNE